MALESLAIEDTDCVVGMNEGPGVDLVGSFGGYCCSCHNMRLGFEPLGLGKSADKVLADMDFLAGKAADSAGIAVFAATAVEMAIDST